MPTWQVILGLILMGTIPGACGAAQGLGGQFWGADPRVSPQYSPSMRATYLAVTDEHVRHRGDFPA